VRIPAGGILAEPIPAARIGAESNPDLSAVLTRPGDVARITVDSNAGALTRPGVAALTRGRVSVSARAETTPRMPAHPLARGLLQWKT
jgi:hypothetical protein